MKHLRVSNNGRFLVQADGSPFFYLGDTAWELFHRLNREEALCYLRDRAAKGYNVIQAVGLAEFHGLKAPNAYGHLPLIESDPERPNEPYWEHVDWIVQQANALGLYIGFLPTWGTHADRPDPGERIVLTPANVAAYGAYLGQRYRDAGLIWILGGDRPPEGALKTWRELARGLRAGDDGAHLMTYHPEGPGASGTCLHDDDWLDFNMIQSGHLWRAVENYSMIAEEYARTPTKPVLDGEPCYEDIAIFFRPVNGWFDDYDARRAAYWSVFSGSCGHTYGCNSIFHFHRADEPPRFAARRTWQDALQLPGASQMRYVRQLIESRPMLTRIPADDCKLSHREGVSDHVAVTRDDVGDGSATYIMAYLPICKEQSLDTSVIADERLRIWRYDPAQGVAYDLGLAPNTGRYEIARGTQGPDSVYVIDAASAGYPAPGQAPYGCKE